METTTDMTTENDRDELADRAEKLAEFLKELGVSEFMCIIASDTTASTVINIKSEDFATFVRLVVGSVETLAETLEDQPTLH